MYLNKYFYINLKYYNFKFNNMTGGLLQIVAKSIEDIYLTSDPEITMFKVVYRRHTNFSFEDKTLKFNSRLDFGKKSKCKIENLGDLIHKLYLLIDIPQIDIYYKHILRSETTTLLKTVDIDWSKEQDMKLSVSDLTEIDTLFTNKITELQNDNTNITNILNTVNSLEDDIEDDSTNDEFYASIKENIIYLDDNSISYKFIKAVIETKSTINLYNFKDILSALYIKLRDNVVDKENSQSSFNDENFIFMDKLERENIKIKNINEGIYSDAVFMTRIKNMFANDITYEPPTGTYTTVDSYKIYENYFNENSIVIYDNFNIDYIKNEIVSNIYYILGKNLQLFIQIYHNLGLYYRFVFYKRFIYDSNTEEYGTDENFVNISTTNVEKFNDLFTNNFTLQPVQGEPENITHFYQNYINNNITNFHITNRDFFNDIKYKDYMTDVLLWGSINFDTYIHSSTTTKFTEELDITDKTNLANLENIYLMNFIPYKLIRNIYSALYNFVNDIMVPNTGDGLGYTNLATSLDNIMGVEGATVITELESNIVIANLIDADEDSINSDVSKLASLSSTYKKSVNDVLLVALFISTNFITYNSTNYNLMEYIKVYYIAKLEETVNHYNTNNTSNTIDLSGIDYIALKEVIEMYFMSYDNIPSYALYTANNYSLFQINSTDIRFKDFFASTTKVPLYYDIISSIWYNIYDSMISSYNNFYNNIVLNNTYIKNSVGGEIEIYKNHIDNQETMLYTLRDTDSSEYSIFYYLTTPTFIENIKLYLNDKLSSYNSLLTRYNNNKNILNIADIIIPNTTHYFEKYDTIYSYLVNIIDNDTDTYNYDSDIINLTTIKDELTTNISAMDIIEELETLQTQFFDTSNSGNTFDDGTPLHDLYDEEIQSLSVQDRINKQNKYTTLLSFTATTLYNNICVITKKFSTLATNLDVYNFLIDVLEKNSNTIEVLSLKSTSKDIPNYNNLTDAQKRTQLKQKTYDNIIEACTNLQNINNAKLDILNGTESTDSLIDILENRSQENTVAKFAWIKRLGHYIIKDMYIEIDGEIIDKQNGEWLQIWNELSLPIGKINAYNKLIGDIEELTNYDNTTKNSHKLYIPLQFWFCKYISAALPLVALNHTDIYLHVELNKLEDCAYWEDYTEFRRPRRYTGHIPARASTPSLDCKILAQYIYVEKSERKQLHEQKHEYLIDTINYNNSILFNKTSVVDNKITIAPFFNNSCKEIFWVIQQDSYIDGTRTNKEKVYHYYGLENDGSKNIIKQLKIKLNNRNRESYKFGSYYNYVSPYKRHTSSPSSGIYSYSFCLYPELQQPSGSLNLSKIDELFIIIELDQDMIDKMNNNNEKLRCRFYCMGQNILRIMSGMAGLAFYS